MGDGGDADGRLGRAVAGEIAGELGVGTFHRVGLRIEPEVALDHDLRCRGDQKIDGLAFDQLDRCAADGAHDVIFAHAFGHRRAAGERERRLPADCDRDRHLRLAAVLPRGEVVPDVLGAPHQDRNLVTARDHAAIDADIHHPGLGILGDAAAIGEEIAPAIEPVPVRHRQLVEIDVLAGDDVFLHRPGCDDLRRDGAGEDGTADLHELPRMGIRRQPHHHGDAAVAVERRAENAPAARFLRVVVLDVVEQHRLAGAGPLRQPHDGAELEVPVHLGIDFLQLARCFERGKPAAQIAEGDGFAFDRHVCFPGLVHALMFSSSVGSARPVSRVFGGSRFPLPPRRRAHPRIGAYAQRCCIGLRADRDGGKTRATAGRGG